MSEAGDSNTLLIEIWLNGVLDSSLTSEPLTGIGQEGQGWDDIATPRSLLYLTPASPCQRTNWCIESWYLGWKSSRACITPHSWLWHKRCYLSTRGLGQSKMDCLNLANPTRLSLGDLAIFWNPMNDGVSARMLITSVYFWEFTDICDSLLMKVSRAKYGSPLLLQGTGCKWWHMTAGTRGIGGTEAQRCLMVLRE